MSAKLPLWHFLFLSAILFTGQASVLFIVYSPFKRFTSSFIQKINVVTLIVTFFLFSANLHQFGNVTTVTRLTEKDSGKKRGFGFVEFDDYDPVDKTIQKQNHEIKGRHVDVKKAISKQEINSMGGPRAVKLNGRGSGGGGGGGNRRNNQGGGGGGMM